MTIAVTSATSATAAALETAATSTSTSVSTFETAAASTPHTGQTIKLAKYLALSGVASRRASEQLILEGRVKVNGVTETTVATRIDPVVDRVMVGQSLVFPQKTKITLLLHKPAGYVSTVSDPDGKSTVMDLIPEKYQEFRLFPIGRLDEDSEGLILLSNDGDLAYRLTHPKFEVPKTYEVTVEGKLTEGELHRLETGIRLKEKITEPAEVLYIDQPLADMERWQITITEGLHRQVRRMFAAVNHEVVRLIRQQFGDYRLGDLPVGEVIAVPRKMMDSPQNGEKPLGFE